MLPFSVQQLVERGGESEGIFAYQLVGTDAPGFGMLGIGIEGDAGDVEEGSFFGDVSRVGDDAPNPAAAANIISNIASRFIVSVFL